MGVLDVLGVAHSVYTEANGTVDVLFTKPKPKPHPKPFLVKHTLFLLPILALLSATVLLATYLYPKLKSCIAPRRQPIFLDGDELDDADFDEPAAPPPPPRTYLPSQGLWADLKAHCARLKVYGTVIISLDIIRTLCLCTLLGLSIYATIQAESPPPPGGGGATASIPGLVIEDESQASAFLEAMKKKKKKKNRNTVGDYSSLEWGEAGACFFYFYNLILSLALLRLRQDTIRRSLTKQIDVMLLLAFCLFAYRDIWPKFTYYLEPSDLNNAITWSRIAILGVAGIVIPLLRPRTYVPADPLNPTPPDQVHPEQTAPPLSFIFYEYMTGLVMKAWRSPSLPYEELHPLADYDRAQLLYDKHIETLDPVRRRKAGKKPLHLFWSLLTVFRREFVITSVMCFISASAEMIPTVAINQILTYIQTDGEGARIKPIVWVLSLLVAPMLSSLAIQYYVFVMTRSLVRAEALLTQLLFDQALRLRMTDTVGTEEEAQYVAAEDAAIAIPSIEIAAASAIEIEGNEVETPDVAAAVEEEVKAAAGGAPGQGIAGKINVLMAQDIETVIEARDLPLTFVYGPTQLILCMVVLYRILSWSALFGVGVMILTFPIPGYITKWATDVQHRRMAATDARVDAVTEAIGALRIIKMFGWEDRIKARISAKREVELDLTWKRRLMNLLNYMVNLFLPVITMVASFASYTLIQKKPLTAATVFTSMVVFEILKGVMGLVIYMISNYVTAGVSLSRVNEFLNNSDMIDMYSQGERAVVSTDAKVDAETQGLIRFKGATFAWGEDTGNKNIINFRLRVPDLTLVKNKVNLITGPTGSGKSSFLKALVGELHFEPEDESSFFHLPREGGVSYAAQESWVLSDTVKENILFGNPYDEARYRQVIHDCALETDLTLFEDGENTEIGEKGVTLSGGQKARITLARAIYSNTAVVLLDDIFSALDTLTSRFILDNLFRGDLVKDRTIALVTHHLHLASPIAAFIITLGEDGKVASFGSLDSAGPSSATSSVDLLKAAEDKAASDGSETAGEEEATVAKVADDKPANKLIKDEEKAEGRISRTALLSFFSSFGGPVYWLTFAALLVGGQMLTAFQTYWLGLWAKAYETAVDPRDVSPPYWLGFYIVWVILGLVTTAASFIIYYIGATKASRTIHKKLTDKIFGAYMRFLDSTPVGRLVSRFAKDMKNIDGQFTETACEVAEMTTALLVRFFSAIMFIPLFSIPAIILGMIGGFIAELYMHGQLSVKREMSNAKSPLFSHFASAVNGIVSIRAYGAEEQMRLEARRKADKYTRAATAFYNLNRWVTIRVDMLGGLFSSLLALFLLYSAHLNATKTGFALTQGIAFSGAILWWVRMVNEMEVQGNSVERIEDYLVIDQEPAAVDSKKPPAAWPTSGDIVLNNLCAKYSADGPTVLDNLSLKINSGEKIGIVGRTGSGKSTLALALLRMIPTSGSVFIDGVRTDKINLHDLRTQVTIIPQDPILLSGTLRFNLDPFGDHDDAWLNEQLEKSGLGHVRRASSGTATPMRLTLDTQITAGGSNLSQGQRQLVALARALVRGSKVLILDEATASVDFETDSLIQKSIRELPSSTTVLTVAHRLATVMDYDRILVLGAGKVLEFDSPDVLKANPDSYFAKLVQAMDG